MAEESPGIYGYWSGNQYDDSHAGNEFVFNLWNKVRTESGGIIYVFRSIHGSTVSILFCFMDCYFEKV